LKKKKEETGREALLKGRAKEQALQEKTRGKNWRKRGQRTLMKRRTSPRIRGIARRQRKKGADNHTLAGPQGDKEGSDQSIQADPGEPKTKKAPKK